MKKKTTWINDTAFQRELMIIEKNEKERKLILKLIKNKAFKTFLEYSRRAYLKKYCCYLTPIDFIRLETEPCQYCGGIASGFDKINPKNGYTKSNVTPCCKMCNFMKYTYTQEEFLDHVKTIYNFNFKNDK